MHTANTLLAGGDPQAALAALEQQVRAHPADAKLRVFLFQLLAVLGQWQRALTQLAVCAELDAGTLAMVGTYREALQCEAVREAVFAGQTLPHVFGRPQAWVAWLAEALAADARGEVAAAAALRARAFDAAPPSCGSLNGEPFDWIADADGRLGPILEAIINGRYCWVPFDALSQVSFEAPEDLRDLVWTPAQLTFPHGGATVALVPTRYVGTAHHADGALRLARRTDWVTRDADDPGACGWGQRVLLTSAGEQGVLQCRELLLTPSTDLEAEPDAAA